MTIFNWENLYRAYLHCRESKRKTINALKFEWDLERNLSSLQQSLVNRTYRPGRSICFVITQPKVREIFASDFRDRVVHHLLINQLEEIGERVFIFHSFSCRQGKGVHLAIRQLKGFISEITKDNQRKAFYAQLDVSGFFMSINQNRLYFLLKSLIINQPKPYQWKEEILWLAKKIIFHQPVENYLFRGNPRLLKLVPPRKSLFKAGPNRGLPIGNYSSQFFGNFYLNELDQFIKRKLKSHYYLRYVDDLVLLHQDKEKLEYWAREINRFLQSNLDIQLNPQKTKIQSLERGIDFLGYFLKPSSLTIRRQVVKRLKGKLFQFNQDLKADSRGQLNLFSKEKDPSPEKLKSILAVLNSYYGHFRQADSYHLRVALYQDHFGLLKKYFEPADKNFRYFRIADSTLQNRRSSSQSPPDN